MVLSPRLRAVSIAVAAMLILDATIAVVSVRLHGIPPALGGALLFIDKSLVAFPLGAYLRRRYSAPILNAATSALSAAAVAGVLPLLGLVAYGVQNVIRLGHLRPEWPTVFIGMSVGELIMVACATAAGLLGAVVVRPHAAVSVGANAA